MALFTDGLNTDVSDLRSYDSTALEVATAEHIDLIDKLRLAHKEVGIEICNFLLRHSIPLERGGELHNVVTTEQMAHVHALHALALLYRDAHNCQLNERYKGKWREYERQADLALRRLFETGIGIVLNPVPRADLPLLSTVLGGSLPARTYSISIAWVGMTGRAGGESGRVSIEVSPGMLVSVAAPAPPSGLTGFVVTGGETQNVMQRQNLLPSSVADTWREPPSGLRQDLPPWEAQRADYFVANRRQLLRG